MIDSRIIYALFSAHYGGAARTESRVADRPHHWTIAVSLLAVTISLLSVYESHESRKLNEETRKLNEANRKLNEASNRAVIQPIGVKLLSNVDLRPNFAKRPSSTRATELEITLYNAGKSLAKNIKISLSRQMCVPSKRDNDKWGDGSRGILETWEKNLDLSTNDMGPNVQSNYTVRIPITDDVPPQLRDRAGPFDQHFFNHVTELRIWVTVAYQDVLSTQNYRGESCYHATTGVPGYFFRTSLQPCEPQQRRPVD
jgi:hypothetical protein